MAETAALLAEEVLPERPFRQGLLSQPHALRFLLASDPDALTLLARCGVPDNLPPPRRPGRALARHGCGGK